VAFFNLSPREHLHSLGKRANWLEMHQICQIYASQADAQGLIDLARSMLDYGFVSKARELLKQAQAHRTFSDALGTLTLLARAAHECGEHEEALALYETLVQTYPGQVSLQNSALTTLQYSPTVNETQCFEQAKMWGQRIMSVVGDVKAPAFAALANRPLRVGFVSADFCQHTVGLFFKDVLAAFLPEKISAITYSNSSLSDWVTSEIQNNSQWVPVHALNTQQFVQRIRDDAIDVLVDLSGHTSGSRLFVFAHRPAPVMVSWLGYFATTGLPWMDAVLLDPWHCTEKTQAQFTERIVQMPLGRFCYQPVPWAPEHVDPVPSIYNGYVTFGSFNNTAKLNEQLLDVWANVLLSVPNSRLVLKWRTFNDEVFCNKIHAAFESRGIVSERVILQEPSFHADLLKAYKDIDIALDPFPFTGGLTSCEALWMGVPVVTWPQSRVVSRQTHALLNQIGMPELQGLSVDSAAQYVSVASRLALDRQRLQHLRSTLRPAMLKSPLMDVKGFARQLEDTLIGIHEQCQLGQ